MNFATAYNEYKEYAKSVQSIQGFKTQNEKFLNHILPYFKDFNIEDIKPLDIVSWHTTILQKNYSNNFNNSLHFSLSAFLSYCCTYHDLPTNVAKVVGTFPRKIEEDKHDVYSYKEFKKFIHGFSEKDYVYKVFFKFLYFTGVRPSEGMALKFDSINGKNVSIKYGLERKGNRSLIDLKTCNSKRVVTIDIFLRFSLWHLKRIYMKEYGMCKSEFFVFGALKPLSPTTIDRKKLEVCKKVGIRPITQHQFRSSHATLLQRLGISVTEISKRLGHSKVSTTYDYYIIRDNREQKRVVKTLSLLRFKLF